MFKKPAKELLTVALSNNFWSLAVFVTPSRITREGREEQVAYPKEMVRATLHPYSIL